MTSIITDDVANRLKLRRSPDNTKICGISGNIQQTRGRSSIEFRSRFTSEELSFKTNVVILKKITSLQHEWFSMLQAKAQMEYHWMKHWWSAQLRSQISLNRTLISAFENMVFCAMLWKCTDRSKWMNEIGNTNDLYGEKINPIPFKNFVWLLSHSGPRLRHLSRFAPCNNWQMISRKNVRSQQTFCITKHTSTIFIMDRTR